MGLFNKKLNVEGQVIITGVPENYGLIVSVAFFKVNESNDEPPYGTDPEEKYIKDTVEVVNDVNLNSRRTNEKYALPFKFVREAGIYYLQVRAIMFRKNGERVMAQTEQFFFSKRPLEIGDNLKSLELPVEWPSIPIEDLYKYEEIKPRS